MCELHDHFRKDSSCREVLGMFGKAGGRWGDVLGKVGSVLPVMGAVESLVSFLALNPVKGTAPQLKTQLRGSWSSLALSLAMWPLLVTCGDLPSPSTVPPHEQTAVGLSSTADSSCEFRAGALPRLRADGIALSGI